MKNKLPMFRVPENLSEYQVAALNEEYLVKKAANHLAQQYDAILREAITAFIGPDWNLDQLQGRIQSVSRDGDPRETICLDGRPILELYPVETENKNDGVKSFMVFSRRYRMLVSSRALSERQAAKG
jgi:hypothetical protein